MLGRMIVLIAGLLLAGCAAPHENPSFPLGMSEAKTAWKAMREDPKPLIRPVVVLGGIYDPGIAARSLAKALREIAGKDAEVIHIAFFETGSFETSADKVIRAVNDRFPSDNPHRTIEVDAIGFSMGGLVARYAASDMYAEVSGQRLAIRRLFTVSSPHRGAKLAWVPTIDRRVVDMRAGSDFLARLNGERRPYELHAYARLRDNVVGEHNAAPPGVTPWWLGQHQGLSHWDAYHDTRILADIARRLRGESPFTAGAPTPLPVRSSIRCPTAAHGRAPPDNP